MYSRNRRNRQPSVGCNDEEYRISPEEEELYSYNLPPRYDGSRFSPCRRYREQERPHEDRVTEIKEDPTEEKSNEAEVQTPPVPQALPEPLCKNAQSGIFDLIGNEELLIISIMLMIAGSEDSGEMLVLLILLLLHG